MSASLVGSEMCIRDSLERRSTGISSPRDIRGHAPVLVSPAVEMATLARDCLLYTSDAADDM
eukprot:9723541-Alexandrium_andersonii.AAC.1